MKRFLTSALVLAMVLSLFGFSALAAPAPQYDEDGTLILDEYPDMLGSAEKQAMAATYTEYLKGEATEGEVADALEAFYAAVGDAEAVENVGQESLFNMPTSNLVSTNIVAPNTVTPYNKSISGFTQFPQENGYFCGPATAEEILYSLLGTQYTQSALATSLGTNSSGTPWYLYGTTYPMASTLNSYANTTWYVSAAAPSADTLKNDVVTDISNDHGVAANFNISSSAAIRPIGYPVRTIQHWVAIYGYISSGSTIKWADPAYNGAGVTWNLSSGYLSDSADNIVTYINTRGIIW